MVNRMPVTRSRIEASGWQINKELRHREVGTQWNRNGLGATIRVRVIGQQSGCNECFGDGALGEIPITSLGAGSLSR